MNPMPATRRVLMLATATALALGACSSSTSGKPDKPTGSTTSTPSSPSPTTSSSGGSTALPSTLLMTGDLPSQWVAKPHDSSTDDSSDTQLEAELGQCLGITVPADAGSSQQINSPDFTLGQSTVSSDSQPTDARKIAVTKQIADSPKAGTCLKAAIQKLVATKLPSGVNASISDTTVSGHRTGQPSNVVANFSAVASVSGQGQSLKLFITETGIASNTIEADISTVGIGATVPTSVVTAAVNAVAKRVAAA